MKTNYGNTARNGVNYKKITAILFCLFVITASTFAVDNQAAVKMNETVNNIVDFFSSGWVKGICCICLIGECLGLLFAGGQNPQIFKKFLPFIIGTVLFMCAGKIVTLVFSGFDGTTFSTDLKGTGYVLPSSGLPSDGGLYPSELFTTDSLA